MKNKNNIFIPVILLASLAAYLNALSNKFVYDDLVQVKNNPWIRDFSHIPEIFTKGAWGYFQMDSNYYRPMMHLIYAADFGLAGMDPLWFHLTNILFHSGVCVLLFLIIFKILSRNSLDRARAGLSAFLAAVIFAVHPIHTEAVTWVAGLPDVSFSFFFLLSFFFYMRAVEGEDFGKVTYVLSLVSFLLSLLCKEPAVMLPLLLIVYDYAVRRASLREGVRCYWAYFVIVIFYLSIRTYALGGFAPNQMHHSLAPLQAALNIFPLFGWYVLKLLFPFNLNIFHTFTPSLNPTSPVVVVSMLFFALFVLALYVAWKRSRPAFFGMLLFAAPLLPALYIPGLGRTIFTERYLYLPSAGFSLLLALLIAKAGKSDKRFAGLAVAASLAVLILLPNTLARNAVWKNGYTLWSDAAAKSPDAATTHDGLGNALFERGRIAESAEQFQTAINLDPNYSKAHENLGNAYARMGRVDEAIQEYGVALRLQPQDASIHGNLGVAYGMKGLYERASEEENAAIKINPNFSNAYFNLGIAYYKMGMREKAVEAVSTACRMAPEEANYRRFLKRIYLQ